MGAANARISRRSIPGGPLYRLHGAARFLTRSPRRRGRGEAERLGGLQVDDQLEFDGLVDRDIAGLDRLIPGGMWCTSSAKRRAKSLSSGGYGIRPASRTLIGIHGRQADFVIQLHDQLPMCKKPPALVTMRPSIRWRVTSAKALRKSAGLAAGGAKLITEIRRPRAASRVV